jgi:hypothetical protein
MKARFKIYRSSWDSWETMCTQVAELLTDLGPNRVIGVSQSDDNNEGVLTVWYWE